MKKSELFAAVAARKAEFNACEALCEELEGRLKAITSALAGLEQGVTLARLTAFYDAVKRIAAGE